MASGSTGSTFSTLVLDSDSFSGSESLPYKTREAMAEDILDVVNSPEAGGRDFRCDRKKRENKRKRKINMVNKYVVFVPETNS